jgi:flavin-binding protein dodecin
MHLPGVIWPGPLRDLREWEAEQIMSENVYKLVELVGSSTESISDAIQNAISRASSTIRNVRWFEVVQVRGGVADGAVAQYQVTLKVGFTLDG